MNERVSAMISEAAREQTLIQAATQRAVSGERLHQIGMRFFGSIYALRKVRKQSGQVDDVDAEATDILSDGAARQATSKTVMTFKAKRSEDRNDSSAFRSLHYPSAKVYRSVGSTVRARIEESAQGGPGQHAGMSSLALDTRIGAAAQLSERRADFVSARLSANEGVDKQRSGHTAQSVTRRIPAEPPDGTSQPRRAPAVLRVNKVEGDGMLRKPAELSWAISAPTDGLIAVGGKTNSYEPSVSTPRAPRAGRPASVGALTSASLKEIKPIDARATQFQSRSDPNAEGSIASLAQTGDVTSGSGGTMAGDILLDGALVGRWVSRLLTRDAERASVGRTGFDIRRGRLLPGPTVGGA